MGEWEDVVQGVGRGDREGFSVLVATPVRDWLGVVLWVGVIPPE